MIFLESVEQFSFEIKDYTFKASAVLSVAGLIASYITQNRLALFGFSIAAITSFLGSWQTFEAKVSEEFNENMAAATEEVNTQTKNTKQLELCTRSFNQSIKKIEILEKQIQQSTKEAQSIVSQIPHEKTNRIKRMQGLRNRAYKVTKAIEARANPPSDSSSLETVKNFFASI